MTDELEPTPENKLPDAADNEPVAPPDADVDDANDDIEAVVESAESEADETDDVIDAVEPDEAETADAVIDVQPDDDVALPGEDLEMDRQMADLIALETDGLDVDQALAAVAFCGYSET